MQSKSQQRRQAVMKAVDKEKPTRPAWQDHQQEETQPKDNDQRDEQKKAEGSKQVTIKMKTAYRDVAKEGDAWTTDSEKAEELVKLGRAEYVD